MTDHRSSPEIPSEWDHLSDRQPGDEFGLETDRAPSGAGRGSLLLAALADLVTILLLCAAALAAVRLAGLDTALVAVPWAAILAAVWWSSSAAVLLTVRRSTPGLLLVGLAFVEPVARGRVAATVATALGCALLLGLPILVGGRRSLLERVGRSAVGGAPWERAPAA